MKHHCLWTDIVCLSSSTETNSRAQTLILIIGKWPQLHGSFSTHWLTQLFPPSVERTKSPLSVQQGECHCRQQCPRFSFQLDRRWWNERRRRLESQRRDSCQWPPKQRRDRRGRVHWALHTLAATAINKKTVNVRIAPPLRTFQTT